MNRLASELRALRQKKGVSLRTIEAKTGISNAYLSQLERGVAANPTPAKLRALAEYFGTSFMDLLAYAGHLPSTTATDSGGLIAGHESAKPERSPLSAGLTDLTKDEEDLVLQYIDFLKSRRDKPSRN